MTEQRFARFRPKYEKVVWPSWTHSVKGLFTFVYLRLKIVKDWSLQVRHYECLYVQVIQLTDCSIHIESDLAVTISWQTYLWPKYSLWVSRSYTDLIVFAYYLCVCVGRTWENTFVHRFVTACDTDVTQIVATFWHEAPFETVAPLYFKLPNKHEVYAFSSLLPIIGLSSCFDLYNNNSLIIVVISRVFVASSVL